MIRISSRITFKSAVIMTLQLTTSAAKWLTISAEKNVSPTTATKIVTAMMKISAALVLPV